MFKFFKKDFKPFNEGFLDKGNHKIYFHEYGNPNGEAFLFFHGGPGGRSKYKHTNLLNLKKHRAILFDQRGGGKSVFKNCFKENNTALLIEDVKDILDMLNVKKANLVGGSWGSTLALLFAQKYPTYVSKMFLALIFLARKQDADWGFKESKVLYPDIYNKIEVKGVEDLFEYYYKLAFSKNKKDIIKSFNTFGGYECILGDLNPSLNLNYEPSDNEIKSYKIQLHFYKNNFFIKENEILENIDKIKHIPTLIVHNRLDLVCTVDQAYDLHKAMPKSKLFIVDDIGHGSEKQLKVFKQEIATMLEDK